MGSHKTPVVLRGFKEKCMAHPKCIFVKIINSSKGRLPWMDNKKKKKNVFRHEIKGDCFATYSGLIECFWYYSSSYILVWKL